MSTKNSPIIIGVTGGSGSGKTTVSKKILEQLDGQLNFNYPTGFLL